MRILFGVQGTGNGHISRCRTLANALAAEGVDVDYLLSGRDAEKYFDIEAFGQCRCYKGLSFVTQNGKISLLKTAKKLHALQLIKDIKLQDLSCYDRIISDFEPITAWAAKSQHIPVLGISNQAIFNYIQPNGRDLIASMVMKHFAPVSKLIGLHWFHFGFPILPPIIDPIEPGPEKGHILIYLPFEQLNKVTQLTAHFCEQAFVCFHPDISQVSKVGNITLEPLSRKNFVNSLRCCSGIITNAGFALVSEALSLGKKILVKPLKGQFEQAYNANCLQQLGLASSTKKLDCATVKEWLMQPSIPAVVYPNVAQVLAKWIAEGEREPIEELSHRLWQEVIFPEQVIQRIEALGLNKLIIK